MQRLTVAYLGEFEMHDDTIPCSITIGETHCFHGKLLIGYMMVSYRQSRLLEKEN